MGLLYDFYTLEKFLELSLEIFFITHNAYLRFLVSAESPK